eukprot:1498647-Amphidinium_carterae.1
MKRTIQEQHKRFPDIEDEVVPLGWTYVAPRGHLLPQRNDNDEYGEVNHMTCKATGISCLVFDMVAELAMWQADLAI